MSKNRIRYAWSLLDFAQKNNLELVYRQALLFISQTKSAPPPPPLGTFLQDVPEDEVENTVERFLELARERINILETEIISAVELSPRQLYELEVKLIRIFRKQLNVRTTVDPSLLGGLRIIAGTTVIDDSVKRKLLDMRSRLYERVYTRDEI